MKDLSVVYDQENNIIFSFYLVCCVFFGRVWLFVVGSTLLVELHGVSV